MRLGLATALLFFLCATSLLHAATIETLVVGNPENAPDKLYLANNPSNLQFGAVSEPYRIGSYEVTNDEYAEFLNAVAATDTHSLYNLSMGNNARGGIARSGGIGSFTYGVKANMGNKPVNFVSFWDAARFANWLDNRQPTGPQSLATTEDGAYLINGVTNPVNDTIFRNPDATWFLPTEDEWYKAAYHHPAAQGGDSDDYWYYPTRSNTDPTPATASSVGNVSNPGTNVVNYFNAADWNGQDGNVTTVGSTGVLSETFYGTSDQGGNVWEWTEGIFDTTSRILRGGSWDGDLFFHVFNLSAGVRNPSSPTFEDIAGGFRVASVLELVPGDANGDGKVDGLDYLIWAENFGDDPADDPPGPPLNGDYNNDNIVDGLDYLVWGLNFGQGPNDSVAVPEPGAFALLIMGMATLPLRRRKRDE